MLSFNREKHPCTVCSDRRQVWKKDVLSQLAAQARPCWKNTDMAKYEADPWEIAKLCMGRGDDEGRTSAVTTDPIGLLQLVLNCRLFDNYVSVRQSFVKVREWTFTKERLPNVLYMYRTNFE